jgi:hypothetical protein
MNKPRRHFSGTEKVAILKRHLLDKAPISDLCDELGSARGVRTRLLRGPLGLLEPALEVADHTERHFAGRGVSWYTACNHFPSRWIHVSQITTLDERGLPL